MPGTGFRARLLQAFGPAMGPVALADGLRAAGGGAVGLALAAVLLAPHADLRLALAMIAPFGATAVLIFAVPNSPLAQPWSAVVGNTVSALVAVAVVRVVPVPALAAALACGLAILAMALARALHPPGGAVALTEAETDAKIQAASYRMHAVGENAGPAQPSIWEQPVRSWITAPLEDGTAGRRIVTGVAFGGMLGTMYTF